MTDIYTGETEPDNDNALWIDTAGMTADEEETVNAITELQEQVADINANLTQLNKLITTGIVPGSVMDSYRRQIMLEMGEAVKPDNAPDTEGEDTNVTTTPTIEPEEPDKTIAEPTVFHNAIKKDTAENFANNKNDLIDGEMIFCTDTKKFGVYYKGKFFFSGSGSTGTSSVGGAGITAGNRNDNNDNIQDNYLYYDDTIPYQIYSANYNNVNPIQIGLNMSSNNLSTKINKNNFICAPDLLRYCSQDAEIYGMFDGCGYSGQLEYGNYKLNQNNLFLHGLTGRIPEYLFKPVPNVNKLDKFFRYCSNISAYINPKYDNNGTLIVDKTNVLQIPPGLFNGLSKLQSMKQMFEFNTFERFANMDVFKPLMNNSQIDIYGIFSSCIWGGIVSNENSKWIISNIFDSLPVINISCAFITIVNGVTDSNLLNYVDYYTKMNYYNYVQLQNIFNNCKQIFNPKNVYKFWKDNNCSVIDISQLMDIQNYM